MTRIRIMSDLHIEFGDLSVPMVPADVAVLAGDIHVGLDTVAWADSLARQLSIPVVVVAGNHEFYGTFRKGSDQHYQSIVAGLRAAAAATAGRVTYLERQTAVVAGVRFIGCTLWTDFEIFGDRVLASEYAEMAMTDFYTIAYRPKVRFKANDARREFLASKQFLAAELAKPFVGSTVVVTHHLPSLKSVSERFRSDTLTAAYASNLDSLVEGSGAVLWIHGHTHDSADYVLAGTRVICNPRGYYGIELNPDFDPTLVVSAGES
jgi:Icc-related predicted phosphoesterase